MSLSFALPPRNTFFNLALSSSMTLLASYISRDITPVIGADAVVFPDKPGDSELCRAIRNFVDELRQGEYGLMPPLGPDFARLRNLRDFLSRVSGTTVELRAESLLDAYAKYTCELARKGQLVSELEKAFGVFKDGYPNDAGICEIPMLTTLAPEFMEGARMLGTIGFGSVSDRYAFSRMRIGPHSACLGIAGLWSSLVAAEDNLEYFIFSHVAAIKIKDKVKEASSGNIREAKRRVAHILKGCTPRYIPSLSLAVALITAGIDPLARRMIWVVVQRGARRVDLMEQGLPLSLDILIMFADELYREDKLREEETSLRLLNLIGASLREPPAGAKDAQNARKLHDVGMRAAQLIYLTLTRVLDIHELRYQLARLLYAQSDLDFENYAVRKKAFLKPQEVERIASTIERISRIAEAPGPTLVSV
jgi:hypothetical protein